MGSLIERCVNIGHIQSGSFDIAGGIAGFLFSGGIFLCTNAGIIDGANTATGGIVGDHQGDHIKCCINTN